MVDRYDEDLFLEYVEGELPVEKRVAFENQMLQDPRLRNLVAQMVIDRHRIRTLPDEAPPVHMMDAVHERLERAMLLGSSPQEFTAPKQAASNGFRWRRMATMGAMAAMISMVAGVFIVTFVQLANDTPIRNVGPGSLFPPGILPPSLMPDNTGSKSGAGGTGDAQGTPSAGINNQSPSQSQSPDLAMRPTDLFPKHPEAGTGSEPDPSQATAAELAAAKAAAAGETDPSTQPQPTTNAAGNQTQTPLTPMPAAAVIFNVSTTDLAAAQHRLTSWANAYQAKLLDTRNITAAALPSKPETDTQKTAVTAGKAGETADTDATGKISPSQINSPSTPISANKAIAIEPPEGATEAAVGTDTLSASASGERQQTSSEPTGKTTGKTTQPTGQGVAVVDTEKTTKASASTDASADAGADTEAAPAAEGVNVTLEITPDLLLPLETFLATLPGVEVKRTDTASLSQSKAADSPGIKSTDDIAAPLPPVQLPKPQRDGNQASFPAAATGESLFDQFLPAWISDLSLLPHTEAPANVKPATTVVRVQIVAKPA